MLIDLKNKFSDPSKKLSTKLEPVLNAVLVAVWCLRMPESSHVSCKSCVQLRSVQLLNYLRFIYFIFSEIQVCYCWIFWMCLKDEEEMCSVSKLQMQRLLSQHHLGENYSDKFKIKCSSWFFVRICFSFASMKMQLLQMMALLMNSSTTRCNLLYMIL